MIKDERKVLIKRKRDPFTLVTSIVIVFVFLSILLIYYTNYLFLISSSKMDNEIKYKNFGEYALSLNKVVTNKRISIKSLIIEKEDILDKLKIDEEKVEDKKPDNNFNPPIKKVEKRVYFTASLSGSAGYVGVSGEAQDYEVLVNNNPVIKNKNGYFATSASSDFRITFKGKKLSRTIQVVSPVFATSYIVEYLSISVNPISLYATLSGKINLALPGDIKGTFINSSNGSSDSTILKNGSFVTSVSLINGVNNLTASGSWITIKVDLPTINVNIIN